MMQCTLCGKEAKLVKAEIEGVVVDVCESCVKFGSKVFRSDYKTVARPMRLEFKDEEAELVSNYGKRIESARCEKGLTREGLAKALSEKESVIRRVEEEKMVPDERLAKKLERFLGVKLSEEYRQEKRKLEKRGKLDLTLGDVVEIK